jgi:hypothetical protein
MGREDVVPEKWEAGGIAFVEGRWGFGLRRLLPLPRERRRQTGVRIIMAMVRRLVYDLVMFFGERVRDPNKIRWSVLCVWRMLAHTL